MVEDLSVGTGHPWYAMGMRATQSVQLAGMRNLPVIPMRLQQNQNIFPIKYFFCTNLDFVLRARGREHVGVDGGVGAGGAAYDARDQEVHDLHAVQNFKNIFLHKNSYETVKTCCVCRVQARAAGGGAGCGHAHDRDADGAAAVACGDGTAARAGAACAPNIFQNIHSKNKNIQKQAFYKE